MDTTHDTSFYNPHDRSNITNVTFPSSYTDYGIRRPYHPSFIDPTTHSIISMPAVRMVEIDTSPQMFPSHPKCSLITSVVFTFVCCFPCSLPAIIYSRQALGYKQEGETRLAASLANTIAFWLAMSFIGGVLWWSFSFVFLYAYRFK